MQTTQLFTWASLATLQGSTLAAWLVPNVVGSFVALGRRWRNGICIVIALLVSFLVAASSTTVATGAPAATVAGSSPAMPALEVWIVALLNGLLIYASAIGINQLVSGARGGGIAEAAPHKTPKAFRLSWL